MYKQLVLSICILSAVQLSWGTDYAPSDHGGGNVTLNNGDRIWGVHTNIGTFSIPAGKVAYVREVLNQQGGSVRIEAQTISLQGNLDGAGRGYPGGEGGYPGSGCSILCTSPGGPGYPGEGPFGGAGGTAASAAGNGGYAATGINGDASTDTSVLIGSGGGGWKGDDQFCGLHGCSSSGNFGARGGNGGAAIELVASQSFTAGSSAGVYANGNNYGKTGGAGGGVLLDARSARNITLAPGFTVEALGGAGAANGGTIKLWIPHIKTDRINLKAGRVLTNYITGPAAQLQMDKYLYGVPGGVILRLYDSDLAGAGSVAVAISSLAESTTETMQLNEIGTDGSFEGSIELVTGIPTPDGKLQVGAADTITATYVDANDGTGQSVVRMALADVDSVAPSIEDIAVTSVNSVRGTVSFTTDEATTAEIRLGTDCLALTRTLVSALFGTSHSIFVPDLLPGTTYYFSIRAADPAGNLTTENNGGTCHSFTTLPYVAPDYFTEHFASIEAFDLSGTSLTFTPDDSINYYRACSESVSAFPTDPAGGAPVALSNEYGAVAISFPTGKAFSLFGVPYNSFYVSQGGAVVFQPDYNEVHSTEQDHFRVPEISALSGNLTAGSVTMKQLNDRIAVTYVNVPESYYTSRKCSFQIEMFYSGVVRITWLNMDYAYGFYVGLSDGNGVPAGFQESDLSAESSCNAFQVLPLGALQSIGKPGGPFTPACASYVISNTGESGLNVETTSDQPWLTVDPPSTVVPAGESTTITVCINDDATSQLAEGIYPAAIRFTDTSSQRISSHLALLTIVPLAAPVVHVSPADGAVGVDVNSQLVWSGGSGADQFDVYLGDTNPPPLVASLSKYDLHYVPATLRFDTTYYWRVVPHNRGGDTPTAVRSFHTQVPPQLNVTPTSVTLYCEVHDSTRTAIQISNMAAPGTGVLKAVLAPDVESSGTEKNEFVGTNHVWRDLKKYTGNCYFVTTSTVLTRFYQQVFNKLYAAMDVEFVVFESATSEGNYTRVYSQMSSLPANNYSGFTLSNMNVPLLEGRYYILAVGTSSQYGEVWYNSPQQSASTAFGQQLGAFEMSSFPSGESVSHTMLPGVYWQQLTTNSSRIFGQPSSVSVPGQGSTICNIVGSAGNLPEGSYQNNLVITSNDPAHPLTLLPVTLVVQDTLPPRAPAVPDLLASSDTGLSNSDNITAQQQPKFIGAVTEESTVTIYLDDVAVATVPVVAGVWNYEPELPLADGVYVLQATATDPAGRTSSKSTALSFTVDTSAETPSALMVAPQSDTGASTTDGVTAIAFPTIVGIAEPGSFVEVLDNGVVTSNGYASLAGDWAILAWLPPGGTHSVTAVMTDLAGNTSDASLSLPVVVDQSRPNAVFSELPGILTSSLTSIEIHLTEPLSNFGLDSIALVAPGGETVYSPIPGATLTGGPLDYVLGNLEEATSRDGSYHLFIPEAVLTDLAGNHALFSPALNWTKNSTTDLQVSMSVVPDTITTVGQLVTYTVQVYNAGPLDASGVQIQDSMSTNCSYVSCDTPGARSYPAQHRAEIDLGSIASLESRTVNVTYMVTEIGSVVSHASVECLEPDADTSNNSATVVVDALLDPGPDLLGHGIAGLRKCRNKRGIETCTLPVHLTVQNRGTAKSNKSLVTYYLSNDDILDDSDILITAKRISAVRAGRAIVSSVKLHAATMGANLYVLARIEPWGAWSEASPFNNVAVIGPLP